MQQSSSRGAINYYSSAHSLLGCRRAMMFYLISKSGLSVDRGHRVQESLQSFVLTRQFGKYKLFPSFCCDLWNGNTSMTDQLGSYASESLKQLQCKAPRKRTLPSLSVSRGALSSTLGPCKNRACVAVRIGTRQHHAGTPVLARQKASTVTVQS